MNPELIKAEIRMKGITPTALARSLGLSGACISHVIYGRGTSARVSQRISEITGIPIEVLWPSKTKPPLRGRPVKSRATL